MEISRIVTNFVFYFGVFLFWVGDWFWEGFGAATALTGIALMIAGAVRYLFEKVET